MKNVSGEQMRAYLTVFHATYARSVEQYVPPEHRSHLVRYSKLPTGVRGFVSTQFGAGYEYIPGPSDIEVRVTSKPVDEAFFDLPRAMRNVPVAIGVIGQGITTIRGIGVRNAIPLRLGSIDAVGRLMDVPLEVGSVDRVISFAELYGNRTADFWSEAKAIERAMDEVLIAMVDVLGMQRQSASLDDYLSTFKKQTVLLLGDFSAEGRSRLDAIRSLLAAADYVVITLDEVPELPEYDLRQKLVAVASVCRFVVIDDSSKAGQAAELPYVAWNEWIAVVLRLEGGCSTYVTRPLAATSRVIREADYRLDNLVDVLLPAVAWAEEQVNRLGRDRADEYPWRREL